MRLSQDRSISWLRSVLLVLLSATATATAAQLPEDPAPEKLEYGEPGYAGMQIDYQPHAWTIFLYGSRANDAGLSADESEALAAAARQATGCDSVQASYGEYEIDQPWIGGDCPWPASDRAVGHEGRSATVHLAPLVAELRALEIGTFTVSSPAFGTARGSGARSSLILSHATGAALEVDYGTAQLDLEALAGDPAARLELSIVPVAWGRPWLLLLISAFALHLAFGLGLRWFAGRALGRARRAATEDRDGAGPGLGRKPGWESQLRAVWWRLGRYQLLLTLVALVLWLAAPVASGLIAATDWLEGPAYRLRLLALAVSVGGFLATGALVAAGLEGLRQHIRPPAPLGPPPAPAAPLFVLRWSTLLVPFLLAFATADAMQSSTGFAATTGVLAIASSLILLRKLMKVSGLIASTLGAGELRTTILEMAQAGGVRVGSLLLASGRELRIANAAVMAGRRMMITEYLVTNLDRHEVRAIVGHELSHLRHGDIGKRVAAMFVAALVGVPVAFIAMIAVFVVAALFGTEEMGFGQALPIAIMGVVVGVLTSTAFAFLIFRQQEFRADHEGAAATDPETMIRALVRMTHVSWMPMDWSLVGRVWATHPSTSDRIQRIARRADIADDRLATLVVEATAERPHLAEAALSTSEVVSYPVPETTDERVFCHTRRSAIVQRLALIQLLIVVCMPLAVTAMASARLPLGAGLLAILLLAPMATVATHWILFDRFAYLGYPGMARAIGARLKDLGRSDGDRVFVGLAAGDRPLLYETHWDRDLGWLTFEKEALIFEDDCQRFEIPRNAVVGCWLGEGPPALSSAPRLYLSFRQAKGLETLSFSTPSPVRGPSKRASSKAVRQLHERVKSWLGADRDRTTQPTDASAAPFELEPSSPEGTDLGAVLSKSMVFAMTAQSGVLALTVGLLFAAGGAIGYPTVPAMALASALSILGITGPQLRRRHDNSPDSSRPPTTTETESQPQLQ